MLTAIGLSLPESEQQKRMRSPHAMDTYSAAQPSSTSPKRTDDSSSTGQQGSSTDNKLRDILEQRANDVQTRLHTEFLTIRRGQADDELRSAELSAIEQLLALGLESESQLAVHSNSVEPTSLRESSQRCRATSRGTAGFVNSCIVGGSSDGQRALSSRSGQRSTAHIPASPMLTPRPSPSQLHISKAKSRPAELVPPTPKIDSLSHMVPLLLTEYQNESPVGGSNYGPRSQSRQPATLLLPSCPGARSASPRMTRSRAGTAAQYHATAPSESALKPAAPALPMSFYSTHFQSVTQWAEMSLQEALVAATKLPAQRPQGAIHTPGATCEMHPEVDNEQHECDSMRKQSHALVDVHNPNRLLASACLAILDQLLSNTPGCAALWDAMRPHLFAAVFRLQPNDVAPADSAGASGARHHGSSKQEETGEWFVRTCARRQLWAEGCTAAEGAVATLQEKMVELKTSMVKYDRIFDIYGRTSDRSTLRRVFRSWKVTTWRHLDHSVQLTRVFSRLTTRPKLMTAFYGWRQVVMHHRLKFSRDKEESRNAVQEAKLKSKAAELGALQRQLELETQRLQAQADRETKKQAALLTTHAVEVRELQSMQDSKDDVILSLEKVAKRWERVAKTFRPRIQCSAAPSRALQHSAKALLKVEHELIVKGPSGARFIKAREELDYMLCNWVNGILDALGSRASRLRRAATDVRDGEALLVLCKYLLKLYDPLFDEGSTQIEGTSHNLNTLGTGQVVTSGGEHGAASSYVSPDGTPPQVALLPRSASMLRTATSTGSFRRSQAEITPATSAVFPAASGIATPAPAPMAPAGIHALLIQTLYAGTHRGLSPPLVALCPFASKILHRESFLVHHHPSVGLWILSSLFVNHMLFLSSSSTAAAGGSNYDRLFAGSLADEHITNAWEYAAMVMDRGESAVYRPRKMSVTNHLGIVVGTVTSPTLGAAASIGNPFAPAALKRSSSVKVSSEPISSLLSNGPEMQQSCASTKDDVFSDTASDIDAYFGKQTESSEQDTAGETFGEDPFGLGVDSNSDVDESPEPSEDILSPLAPQQQQQRKASTKRLSPRTSTISSTTTQPSATLFPSALSTPSSSAHVSSPADNPSVPGKRAMPAVDPALAPLPLHALVRLLRHEAKNAFAWKGLARVISSLVLRFRVIDVDAPLPVTLPQKTLISEPVASRQSSIVAGPRSNSLAAVPVAPPQPPPPQPPATSNEPPSTTVPRSVPRQQAKPSVAVRGGEAFFRADAPAAMPSVPPLASPSVEHHAKRSNANAGASTQSDPKSPIPASTSRRATVTFGPQA